jgi:hypothetical protein
VSLFFWTVSEYEEFFFHSLQKVVTRFNKKFYSYPRPIP